MTIGLRMKQTISTRGHALPNTLQWMSAGAGFVAAAALVVDASLVPAAGFVAQLSPCNTRSFEIRETPSQGAGGSFYLNLSYRNVTRSSCQTAGVPGVTLVGRHNRALGTGTPAGGKIPKLVVKPHSRIYGVIQYVENPAGDERCPAVKAVRIIVPNSAQSTLVRLPNGSQYCRASQARISVSPLARSLAKSLNDH